MNAKWLELLKTIAPDISRVAVMLNSDDLSWAGRWRAIEAAAHHRGRGIVALQDARSAPSRVHSQIHPLSPVEAIAASAPGANITIPPRSSKTKFCRCHRRSCLFVLSLDMPMISLR